MIKRFVPAPLALALTLAPIVFVASSCACGSDSTASATASPSAGCTSSGSVQPCSPYAEEQNSNGKIGVQQAGPQKPVAWGVYPKDPVGDFTVTITVDGQVYDKKSQPYPPHGSIAYDAANRRYLPSGATFRIDGTIARPNGGTEVFYFQCTLA
jgi:hypothetical protein